jgi:hypothetical protein
VTENLLHAAKLPASRLDGRRSVTFPGLCVTPAEMLAGLERFGGPAARALVRCEEDPQMMRIVCTWPGAFDTARAVRLGFTADRDVDAIVRQFITEEGISVSSCRPGSEPDRLR